MKKILIIACCFLAMGCDPVLNEEELRAEKERCENLGLVAVGYGNAFDRRVRNVRCHNESDPEVQGLSNE